MASTAPEGTDRLKLAGSLDIAAADELRARLAHYVAAAAEPVIDLSAVEHCDVAGAQLLWAALRTAAHGNKRLTLTGWPEAMERAAASLGLPIGELPSEGAGGL